jgi:hypothetical protein
MDALPAPEHATGLSTEEAEAMQQVQALAQAAVQPWIFAGAVLAISALVVALLALGRAEPKPDVDTAELLVPLVPGPGQDPLAR